MELRTFTHQKSSPSQEGEQGAQDSNLRSNFCAYRATSLLPYAIGVFLSSLECNDHIRHVASCVSGHDRAVAQCLKKSIRVVVL